MAQKDNAQSGRSVEPAPIVKRSVAIAGHRTSISVEEPFWRALKEIASVDSVSLSELLAEIDRTRPPGASLSSSVRLFVLRRYQELLPLRS